MTLVHLEHLLPDTLWVLSLALGNGHWRRQKRSKACCQQCISRESNCNGSPEWINGKEHYSSAFGIILGGDCHKATGLIITFRCGRHTVSIHSQPYSISRKTVQNPVNLFSKMGWTITLWAVASIILNADTLQICMRIVYMHGMSHDFAHACYMSSALWWSSCSLVLGQMQQWTDAGRTGLRFICTGTEISTQETQHDSELAAEAADISKKIESSCQTCSFEMETGMLPFSCSHPHTLPSGRTSPCFRWVLDQTSAQR